MSPEVSYLVDSQEHVFDKNMSICYCDNYHYYYHYFSFLPFPLSVEWFKRDTLCKETTLFMLTPLGTKRNKLM